MSITCTSRRVLLSVCASDHGLRRDGRRAASCTAALLVCTVVPLHFPTVHSAEALNIWRNTHTFCGLAQNVLRDDQSRQSGMCFRQGGRSRGVRPQHCARGHGAAPPVASYPVHHACPGALISGSQHDGTLPRSRLYILLST